MKHLSESMYVGHEALTYGQFYLALLTVACLLFGAYVFTKFKESNS